MEEYLYRYISFEAFVGMVQTKSLTFVSPELWDDPKEGAPFEQLLLNLDDGKLYERIMLYSVYNKTYAQCWTELSESDAMWRIYSFNNRAVQVKVSKNNLRLLPDVHIIPVKYSDEMDVGASAGIDAFLQSLATKRRAFEHEREVRLIKHYRFSGEDDLEQHIKAFMATYNESKRLEVIDSMYPELTLEEKVNKVVELLNIGKDKKKTLDISFQSIPHFIVGVKVHPLAPDWYVSIVEEYCKRNDLPFDGRSTLYSKD